MNRLPDRRNYLRDQEEYGTPEISAYAREILTRACDDTAYNNKLTTSWDTEDALVYLTCLELDKESPTYQMNVRKKSNPSEDEYICMFDAEHSVPGLYYVLPDLTNEKVDCPNPHELTITVMSYLRQHPAWYIAEPRSSQWTNQAFDRIMANLAIDTAIEQNTLDMQQLALKHANGMAVPPTVVSKVLTQEMTVDNMSFPYTRSEINVFTQLNQRVVEQIFAQSARQITPKNPADSESHNTIKPEK